MKSLFRTRDIDSLIAEYGHPERGLRRTLGPWSLTALGIGSIIGTGIFILTGIAAAGEVRAVQSFLNAPLIDIILHGRGALGMTGRPGAGPGIALSYLLVAFVCVMAGLCYAELASMIPIAGSAYTYSFAILGEIVAWIIGWDLILEYAVSNMATAVGFSAYVGALFQSIGLSIPRELMEPVVAGGRLTGAWFNMPAFIVIMILTVVLVKGIRESAGANNLMVVIKIIAILVFLGAASRYVDASNWKPFFPNGWQGVLSGGAIVFFTYIGFDSISTAAEECRRPQRDIPFGILASLIICAVLYVSVALVLTGIQHWSTLRNAAPVANALNALGLESVQRWVTLGALTGMISSLLVYQYGQARVWFAMSRDGLLPGVFSRVHHRYRTPYMSTWIAGFFVAIPAGIFDIGTLADLSNIGTLFAFILVAVGVIVHRRRYPHREREFRAPLVPLLPIVSIASCLVLMVSLPVETWIRFVVWLCAGLLVYFFYGRSRSVEAVKPGSHAIPAPDVADE